MTYLLLVFSALARKSDPEIKRTDICLERLVCRSLGLVMSGALIVIGSRRGPECMML